MELYIYTHKLSCSSALYPIQFLTSLSYISVQLASSPLTPRYRACVHFPSPRSVHQPQWENAALSSAFSQQCIPCQILRLPSFFPWEGVSRLHFLYQCLLPKPVLLDYLLIHIHFVRSFLLLKRSVASWQESEKKQRSFKYRLIRCSSIKNARRQTPPAAKVLVG